MRERNERERKRESLTVKRRIFGWEAGDFKIQLLSSLSSSF